jgi:hypothetical protein
MRRLAYALALLASVGWPAGVTAQNVVTLQFSFSNPGARSLGLGGAFVALADDATAAYANPAGLTQLAEPEVSVEGRSRSYATSYVEGGRASGLPTGLGLDTVPGIRRGVSEDRFSELSFLSLVYPRGRFTWALYRHQLARFASSFEPQGLFAEGTTFLGTDRFVEQPGSNRLATVNLGLSVGYRVTDGLSVGLGISRFDSNLAFGSAGYLPDDDTVEGFFGTNNFRPERQIFDTMTVANGSQTGFTLGLLWRFAELWRVGASYRESFEVPSLGILRAGPAAPPDLPTVLEFQSNWVSPEVWGAGVAFQSRDGRLTASLEWDHVAYSQILSGDPDERIPDADELHLGGEYVFLRGSPIVALRLGAWLDPDHRIQATAGDVLFRALLPPGEDEIHLAAGVGMAFERFQVDLAADLSEPVDTVAVSAVYSF